MGSSRLSCADLRKSLIADALTVVIVKPDTTSAEIYDELVSALFLIVKGNGLISHTSIDRTGIDTRLAQAIITELGHAAKYTGEPVDRFRMLGQHIIGKEGDNSDTWSAKTRELGMSLTKDAISLNSGRYWAAFGDRDWLSMPVAVAASIPSSPSDLVNAPNSNRHANSSWTPSKNSSSVTADDEEEEDKKEEDYDDDEETGD
jgi:hypothetical protein